jgi:hypothetical protein
MGFLHKLFGTKQQTTSKTETATDPGRPAASTAESPDSSIREAHGEEPQQDMGEVRRLIGVVLHTTQFDEREQALAAISQLPNRDEAIPIVMELLHRGESAHYVSAVLKAIGSPATIDPLFEVFRSAEPSRFVDDGVRVRRAAKKAEGWANAMIDTGNDDAPAIALVKLDPSLQVLRSKCSTEELEKILMLAIYNKVADNPQVYQALVELDAPKAAGLFIQILDSTIQNRGQQTQRDANELAGQALISMKESALPRIRGALEEPSARNSYPGSEVNHQMFHDQLESVQAAITKP